jgi:hypothetical protein
LGVNRIIKILKNIDLFAKKKENQKFIPILILSGDMIEKKRFEVC